MQKVVNGFAPYLVEAQSMRPGKKPANQVLGQIRITMNFNNFFWCLLYDIGPYIGCLSSEYASNYTLLRLVPIDLSGTTFLLSAVASRRGRGDVLGS